MNTVHTCKYKNVVQRIQQTELVKATVSDMPPFPADCNPFHYDTFSMGTDLLRGWMVMHAGSSDTDGFEDFYLVNTKTGQRLQIDFESKTPRYEESVYVGESAELHQGDLYTWSRVYEEVKWVSLHDLRVLIKHRAGISVAKLAPVYVYVDKWFVLYDVIKDAEKRAAFIESHEPATAAIATMEERMEWNSNHYDAFMLQVAEAEKGIQNV